MSVAPLESGPGVVDAYRARTTGGRDELLDDRRAADQRVLVEALDGMGLGALRAASAEASRLGVDDGIRYGAPNALGQARNWVLDPIPVVIGADEWADLRDGLDQRAHLLDAIVRDCYGPRQLLEQGLIPPQVVLGHPAFIPQADGVLLPGPHLVLTSTDLIRDAGGRWTVVGDRTAAPSGAGYAMANRRIVSRVMAGLHRTTQLARLRGFFQTMRNALQEAAPTDEHTPRGVLLSPGTSSETAYEQGFLATLLGFPLVEAEDLTMRDGRVWITASDRLDPVDVVMRRVDSAFSDPLDLRPDSRLGVPGLLEAARRRTVAVVNPIGTGVLENAGLLAFLPAVSRAVLGEDLRIDSVETLWLGDERALRRVLGDLESWVVKPISRLTGRSLFGSRLSAAEHDELRRRIQARPWAYAAQADIPVSTAPVVTPTGLAPRRFVLRTFAVARGDDYHFLPGGLGRVANAPDAVRVSNSEGALAKDVWVLAPETATAAIELGPRADIQLVGPHVRRTVLAPRVAENLYWVGRYAERAEGTARLLRVVDDLVEDHQHRPGSPGHAVMAALFEAHTRVSGLAAPAGEEPLDTLLRSLHDGATPGTLRYAVRRLDAAAQEVRDLLAYDFWHVLARLERTLRDDASRHWQLQPRLHDVLESTLALAGIFVESMVRDESWGFIDAGTAMERAQHVIALLRSTLVRQRPPTVDGQVSEAVLEVGESIITHRRRTASGEGPAWPIQSAIALLLLDPSNPRSLAFQVARLTVALRVVGDDTVTRAVEELAECVDALDLHAVTADDRAALEVALTEIDARLRGIDDALARRHFSRMAPQRALPTRWMPIPGDGGGHATDG